MRWARIRQSLYAGNADTMQRNGWGGALPANNGTRWLRNCGEEGIVAAAAGGNLRVVGIDELAVTGEERFVTGIREVDRVLGGGVVKGSLVLIGGDPGIGKSTLILQICERIGQKTTALYVSGEESVNQVKMRADRLGVRGGSILLASETEFERIERLVENEPPGLLVIDSVQTVYSAELTSAPGSVSQVREVTARLLRIAKTRGITVFIVGHVTKEGAIAGPRVLEHMVDTVLYFEGERHLSFRILRAVKNRFGSTNEIGIFEMTDMGLQEVDNPSSAMLSGRPENAPGSVVVAGIEVRGLCLLKSRRLFVRQVLECPGEWQRGQITTGLSCLSRCLRKGSACSFITMTRMLTL